MAKPGRKEGRGYSEAWVLEGEGLGSLMDLEIDEVMVAAAINQMLPLGGPVPSMCPCDLIHSVQQYWEF